MERLLYESKGTPKRRAHLLRICGGLICICGAALLLLGMEAPSYVEAKGLIILLGIGAIALGIFFCAMPNFDFAGKACLRLYETYAEGHQVGPSRDFLLPYAEIYNVKKTSAMGNEFIVIETAHDSYAILVNNPGIAFQIINEKLDELEKV